MAIQTRIYRICCARVDGSGEEFRAYRASALGEALMMAERADAGVQDCMYGVCPEDYAQARAEGIAFNEADGLLLDQE